MNVIITGASKGIGKAIAVRFAAAGHDLLLCSRNVNSLAATANEINKNYPRTTARFLAADVSLKEQTSAFATWCLKFGAPDILVNNAGVYLPGNVIDEPDGNLENMMSTNLYSAYYLTRNLLPAMVEKGRGHIFNICSVASLKAYKGGGGYSISKFAMNGFNRNLRHELIPHGIKVTGVFPGAVFTDSWGDFDNSSNRILEANDIADLVYAASILSPQAVVDEIVITPQLGDL